MGTKHFRRIWHRAIGMGLCVLISMLIALPGPAHAAQCTWYPASGVLYLYQHTDHSTRGRCLQFRDGGVQNLGRHNFNDQLSSLRNKTGYTVYLYMHKDGNGRRLEVKRGASWSFMPGGWNDEVSSFCIARPRSHCK